jgi:hypothetical protein
MKRILCGIALGLAGLLVATGCGGIRDGDTITPVLEGPATWTAGQPNELKVRLRASSSDGGRVRDLGFGGIPDDANPKATITFYEGDTAQAPLTVMLDHRC